MSTSTIVTLIYLGLMFVFGIFLIAYKPNTYIERKKIQNRLISHNLTLSEKIDIINGKNAHKQSKLKNYFLDVQIILAKMNKTDSYAKLKLASIVCAILGSLIGVFANNYLLCLITVPLFAFIPFEIAKAKYKKYIKELEEELETSISLITISYTRTGSFVTSIKECLPTLPPKAKVYFEDFLMEVTNINANINTALINMKTKVENRVFQQWVDRVIVCQNDKNAIPSLQAFVTEYADNRNIQNELDAEAFNAKVEMYLMLAMVPAAPGVLYLMQKDAFYHLTHDTAGKIVMFLSLLACVVVYVIGNKIAKPVQFRGNKK